MKLKLKLKLSAAMAQRGETETETERSTYMVQYKEISSDAHGKVMVYASLLAAQKMCHFGARVS